MHHTSYIFINTAAVLNASVFFLYTHTHTQYNIYFYNTHTHIPFFKIYLSLLFFFTLASFLFLTWQIIYNFHFLYF